MLMIRAIVRPERVDMVLEHLMTEGFPAVTRMNGASNGGSRSVMSPMTRYPKSF